MIKNSLARLFLTQCFFLLGGAGLLFAHSYNHNGSIRASEKSNGVYFGTQATQSLIFQSTRSGKDKESSSLEFVAEFDEEDKTTTYLQTKNCSPFTFICNTLAPGYSNMLAQKESYALMHTSFLSPQNEPLLQVFRI